MTVQTRDLQTALIIEDHPLFSDALAMTLRAVVGIATVTTADRLEAALTRQSFHRFTDTTLDTPRALKAELQAIRARGHALDREEHEPGIICIAAPVLTRGGRMLGALSVTTTTARGNLEGLERWADAIKQAAAEIAEVAEGWQFPQP